MTPRILVVDDDPLIGTLLVRGLTPEGYQVEVVPDGITALEQVRLGRLDLTLLDVDLPVFPAMRSVADSRMIRPLSSFQS
jgi:DNA-binding response OmpR family regulator